MCYPEFTIVCRQWGSIAIIVFLLWWISALLIYDNDDKFKSTIPLAIIGLMIFSLEVSGYGYLIYGIGKTRELIITGSKLAVYSAPLPGFIIIVFLLRILPNISYNLIRR